MLRPACLLPVARLAPPGGLLTPRSGTEVSLHYLGPATRRSDAYRDGTLTRWTGAACTNSTSPLRVQSSLCLVTHHAKDCGVACRMSPVLRTAQRRRPCPTSSDAGVRWCQRCASPTVMSEKLPRGVGTSPSMPAAKPTQGSNAMRDRSMNLRDLKGYRRITPLGASTLLWLNSCGGMSGQDQNDIGHAVVGSAIGAILSGRGSTATAGGAAGGGSSGPR